MSGDTMKIPVPTANYLFFSGESFEPQQLEELEKAFFWNVIARNGTFKATNHRRLDDLNEIAAMHLPADRPLKIMDVAVSSGISTGEWTRFLQNSGIQHQMVAGDLLVHAWLVSIGSRLHVLVDKTGYQLQLDIGGNAIRTPLRKRNWLRHGLSILAIKLVMLRAAPALRRASPGQVRDLPLTRFGVRYRPLQLVSRSLREFEQIEVVEDDILNDRNYGSSFHVLRAANILNRVYFDDTTLTAMLRNLRSRLVPGGLLIVCKTTESDDVNHATLFKLQEDGKLAVVARLNGGSEVEELGLGLDSRS
jgi:hypothetical protein